MVLLFTLSMVFPIRFLGDVLEIALPACEGGRTGGGTLIKPGALVVMPIEDKRLRLLALLLTLLLRLMLRELPRPMLRLLFRLKLLPPLDRGDGKAGVFDIVDSECQLKLNRSMNENLFFFVPRIPYHTFLGINNQC